MHLTNLDCLDAACPAGKHYKRHSDGEGPYLEALPEARTRCAMEQR
jgi:hypothetical protein